ncbi:trimeric intracellular cation channel family protein [Lentibacter algarum]|uniref:trimeric intracellular cation channel family protein n=1 Tax=Lentibacter algarum TaxID=576131 RepID=UPI001C07E2EB|nr:trimeric intracellular cation channel family protein [Lentibacter algarum]MBU2981749.1 trimeric intracellular cation channel family protein [Lentibacter algarum]
MSALSLLDYASVFIFALTGALAASRAQLDIIGFAFLASLTAVGGGTLRDLMLDRDPVFWVANPEHIGIACLAAILIFFTAHRFESRARLLLWLDAMALGVAVAAGVGVALELRFGWPVVLMMGVMTGTFGGLMRDVVANEVPMVLRQGELYVSAALGGAAMALVVAYFSSSSLVIYGSSVLSTFVLRAGSITFGWRLPVYKARPPR